MNRTSGGAYKKEDTPFMCSRSTG